MISPSGTALAAEGFVEVGGAFLEEAAGREEHATGAGAVRDLGVAQIEFVLGASHRDIEQAAFFFDVTRLDLSAARK